MHDWEEKRNGACLNVGEEEIADVVSSWTKIPVSKIAEAESEQSYETRRDTSQTGNRPG